MCLTCLIQSSSVSTSFSRSALVSTADGAELPQPANLQPARPLPGRADAVSIGTAAEALKRQSRPQAGLCKPSRLGCQCLCCLIVLLLHSLEWRL